MPDFKSPWPTAENAVASILVRDEFANVRLHYAVRIACLLALAAAFAVACVLVMLMRPPQFRYVMTDAAGKVLPMVPTDKPNKDDEFIIKWTVDAVTRLYSFDFANYRQQLQAAQKFLTVVGWREFEKSLEKSGNFKAVVGNLYVMSAVPTGPGRITRSEIHPTLGRHAWKVEFPMLITYRSSEKTQDGRPLAATQNLRMTVVVIRQPEFLNTDGLGIRSIIAE